MTLPTLRHRPQYETEWMFEFIKKTPSFGLPIESDLFDLRVYSDLVGERIYLLGYCPVRDPRYSTLCI